MILIVRPVFETLKIDIRRLWPAIAGSALLLAALTNMDCWRVDAIPSSTESWLNLVLTTAWSFLIALAVIDRRESGTGWLAPKLVFAGMVIHLPLSIADIFILSAHHLAAHPGDLFSRQILIFQAVTLPSLALAIVVDNFTHYVIAVFCVIAGIAFMNNGWDSGVPWGPPTDVRHAAVLMFIAISSIVIIGLQLSRKRLMLSRLIAVTAALGAALLFAQLPDKIEYSFNGKTAPRISIRKSRDNSSVPQFGGTRSTVLIPISVTSVAPGERFHIPMIEAEIVLPDGSRIASVRPSPNRPFEKIGFTAFAMARGGDWLALQFSPSTWERVKSGRIRLQGKAGFRFYQDGMSARLSQNHASKVAGLGLCQADTVSGRFNEKMLKISCDSSRQLPGASIMLRHPDSGMVWNEGLNNSITNFAGPHKVWLSPIDRGQSFFHLADLPESIPTSSWIVPASYLPFAEIAITPEVDTGRALSQFELSDIQLQSYLVLR